MNHLMYLYITQFNPYDNPRTDSYDPPHYNLVTIPMLQVKNLHRATTKTETQRDGVTCPGMHNN